MTLPLALLVLAGLAAAMAPRVLARSSWPEREPVLGLWMWQCVVAAVLLCCALAMAFSAAAAWQAVRSHVFAPAPSGVEEAYALGSSGPWAGLLAVLLACGGAWTGAMLLREVHEARVRRRRRRAELRERAPRLPGEEPSEGDRLVVLEGAKPDAWWLPGSAPQLVVTTAALRRLKGRQLDAVLEHEQGHARARHDWLLHCSSALAAGFPRVPVFAAFRDQVHTLVEMAADDTASRRFGRLTIALALIELNEERGVFGPCPTPLAQVPHRVHRLLTAPPRLPVARRLRMTAAAAVVPAVPLLVAFVPGLSALR
ncbi:Signal transducer regulating beta-lactamase production, contains metallopeptidase domain [Streptomyces sp. WMMB 714]|uniref:M56 family metallopeptidase n=1 Tax=Streptomyces sp. WMMB 714 TaxID=1286822 RepID=UPI0005F7F27B|nr:M56 family metallopeptidase [Streptomyces sp. WMMB 714]SCK08322.1 Signal transducer regulating beta-lactamase production, contains metallopeptidase domain [Streptomyces sp. WMMB 714]